MARREREDEGSGISGKRNKSWREIDAQRGKSKYHSRQDDPNQQRIERSASYEKYKKAADSLFTGGELPQGLEQTFDPDGKPLWRSGNGRSWKQPWPGARASCAISEGFLYHMNAHGRVACFDAETGKKLWQHLYNDYLSDTVYLRYATSSPTIDPETGNIFIQGTQGLLAAFSPDGQLLWKHELMEQLGRLTFPNSRTATPVVDRDLVTQPLLAALELIGQMPQVTSSTIATAWP